MNNRIKQKSLTECIDFILNRLLIIFFFILIIIYSSREVADLDIWLHLKTGEVVVKNRFVPLYDIFSFTIISKPWINHEWLFQVISYLFYSWKEGDGLIYMQNIIALLIFFSLFLIGRKENNNIFAFIVLYLTLLTVSYRFTIRPDIFSLFFLTLYLLIIKNFIENGSKSIWILPLCQILWVNMHGFSFTGPLLILVFLIGELLKRLVKLPYGWNDSQRLDDDRIAKLVLVFILLVLASLLNPYGLTGAAYPFSVLGQISGKGKIVFSYIQELAKPVRLGNLFDFNHFVFYKTLILFSLFSFRFNQRNLNISDLILWLIFLSFSFIAIRNIAYFAIFAAYCIFVNFDLAFRHKKEIPLKFSSERLRFVSTYAAMAFLFYFPAKGAISYLEGANYNFDTYELKSALWGISEVRYPKKAVEFLLGYNFPKHMLNDFNSGSYLIGHVYPQRHVFIDGRTELYGPDFFTDYVALGEGKKDVLEKFLSRYGIEGFFLSNSTTDLHTGLLRYLFKSPRWKLVYFDEGALVFLKDTKDNAPLIKRFYIDPNKWSSLEPEFLKIGIATRYPYPYVQRGRLLNIMGYREAAAREARIALEIMPHNFEALRIMADYYFEKGDYLEAFKYIRTGLIFSEGDTEMRTKLALIYHFLGEDEKAFKVIDAVLKQFPEFAQGYYVKALIVQDTDREEAKKFLRQAIKLLPKEPKYHIALGDLLNKEGDLAAAQKEWQAAYEYDSANEELKEKIEK